MRKITTICGALAVCGVLMGCTREGEAEELLGKRERSCGALVGEGEAGGEVRLVFRHEEVAGKTIYVAAYGSEEEWRKKRYCVMQATANGTTTRLVLRFPLGRYGLTTYLDMDGSGDLETKSFGRPAEPVALSNGARGGFGPAPWKAAAFDVGKGSLTMEMVLKGY